jgi:LysR family glycine cleavage system transcriptional activator
VTPPPTDRRDTSLRSGRQSAAALAGPGVSALVPEFWRAVLESGRLVQPFELVALNGKDFWLVYPEAARSKRKLRTFCVWLMDEVATARAGDASGVNSRE